jgi:hypothetical protein
MQAASPEAVTVRYFNNQPTNTSRRHLATTINSVSSHTTLLVAEPATNEGKQEGKKGKALTHGELQSWSHASHEEHRI